MEFRKNVGPIDLQNFDNPSGDLVFTGIGEENYREIFDFGCGCGRTARKLLQQRVRPERYVGIDIQRGMIEWNRQNLSAIDPRFQFLVHDVFHPGLAPENRRRDFAPFPVGAGEFTLVNAHAVFTQILQAAAVPYLREVYRILAPSGVARTTWFFFDKRGFPWLEPEQVSLFVNHTDPTSAVIYDRNWFVKTVTDLGFVIDQVDRPAFAGHQWTVCLRKDGTVGRGSELLSDEASEWLCGGLPFGKEKMQKEHQERLWEMRRQLEELVGENNMLRESWSWRLTAPLRHAVDLIRSLKS
jgi:SAM-dependent methyltransferase